MRAPIVHSTSRIRPNGKPRPASARATGHWGELLQGRLGVDGPVALITLRCPQVVGWAGFRPVKGAPLSVSGALGGSIAAQAARAALATLGRREFGGRLVVGGSAAPGAGAGSSTLAALTTMRAVAGAFGGRFPSETEAALCLAVEGASDPLMLTEPARTLWASREGRALALLPPPPPMIAVGALAGRGERTDPSEADFDDISELLAVYRRGVDFADLDLVGAVATESAECRLDRRPIALWRDLKALVWETGAAGIARAHTGSAVALLFEPGSERLDAAENGLKEMGLDGVRRFDPAAPVRPRPRRAAARG